MFTGHDDPYKILSAHRGGSTERLENTLPAFKHAIECGMNLLECDVCITLDNQVIVCHDSDLGRLCGEEYKGKNVQDYNFNDLPVMQREVPLHFSNGIYTCRPEEDGKFLLLREMFEAMPNVFISIDCKGGGIDMCDRVYGLVKEFKR